MSRVLTFTLFTLAALAWSLGWYESGNLWDYLLDPFVAIYALCAIAIQTVKRLINRQRGI